MSLITKQSKFVNLFITVLLISCQLDEITSAKLPEKSTNHDIKVTTEGLDATESGKSTTEGPFSKKESKMESDDDLELTLMDIFEVSSNPKPTAGPQNLDKFSSVEIGAGKDGKMLSLDRRTSFTAVWNCPCIINKRCAESKSCTRKPPSGPW